MCAAHFVGGKRGRERVSLEPLDTPPQPTGAGTTGLCLAGWGRLRAWLSPSRRREGRQWRGGGMSLPPGRLVTRRQERACHRAHK